MDVQPTEEYNASELKFPKEFENAETLNLSEVAHLLKSRKEQNESAEHELEVSEVFEKTFAYVNQFAKFKHKEIIETVRVRASGHSLHPFELASLTSLVPETAEEAKCLIKSLETRIEDKNLQDLIDEMQSKRNFQT